jgi:hypothetical protein
MQELSGILASGADSSFAPTTRKRETKKISPTAVMCIST